MADDDVSTQEGNIGPGPDLGGSSLTEFLKTEFLDDQNNPQWDELAGTVVGAAVLQLYTAGSGAILALGEAADRFYGTVLDGFADGVGSLGSSLTDATASAADPIAAGLFGLFVNVIVLLLAIFLIARATEVI